MTARDVQEVLKEMRERAAGYTKPIMRSDLRDWASRIERALAPAGEVVAWVEVADSYEGPYTFHGIERLPKGKHNLYLASPPAAPQGWREIESAPKDGTRIILNWGGRIVQGFWLDNSKSEMPWAGWRVGSMDVQPSGHITHWMPFPSPPPAAATGPVKP